MAKDLFDQEKYWTEMETMLEKAIAKMQKENPDFTIYTVSITTDPAAAWSSISFDHQENSIYPADYALADFVDADHEAFSPEWRALTEAKQWKTLKPILDNFGRHAFRKISALLKIDSLKFELSVNGKGDWYNTAFNLQNTIIKGNVYAFRCERLDCWCVCQVTGYFVQMENSTSGKQEDQVSVLLFDYTEKEQPNLADSGKLAPYANRFYYWLRREEPELAHHYASPSLPQDYQLIGHAPVQYSGEDLRSWGYWFSGDEITLQRRWDALPKALTKRFQENLKNQQRVTVCGYEGRLDSSSLWRENFGEDVDYDALLQFPCVSKLHWDQTGDGLFSYLAQMPIVNELELLNIQKERTLDFRKTKLQRLTLPAENLEEIYLPDGCSDLVLTGATDKVIRIHAEEHGRWLQLTLAPGILLPAGISALQQFHMSNIAAYDVSGLAEAFPHLTSLRLWGKPGVVHGLSALKKLQNMQYFTLKDLFGFGPEEFPLPEQWPDLATMWLTSVPKEAGEWVKKQYKFLAKEKRLDLDVRQLRAPEWMSENLDNPFANWDGDDLYPRGYAKKAFDLYKAAKKAMLTFDGGVSSVQERCSAAAKDYIAGFNSLDEKKNFIDTVAREDIIYGLDHLLTEAAKGWDGFNGEKIMEECELLRDF